MRIAAGCRIHRIEDMLIPCAPDQLGAGRLDIGVAGFIALARAGRAHVRDGVFGRGRGRTGGIGDGHPVPVLPVDPLHPGGDRLDPMVCLVLAGIDGAGPLPVVKAGGGGENNLRTHGAKQFLRGFLPDARGSEEKAPDQGNGQYNVLFHKHIETERLIRQIDDFVVGGLLRAAAGDDDVVLAGAAGERTASTAVDDGGVPLLGSGGLTGELQDHVVLGALHFGPAEGRSMDGYGRGSKRDRVQRNRRRQDFLRIHILRDVVRQERFLAEAGAEPDTAR